MLGVLTKYKLPTYCSDSVVNQAQEEGLRQALVVVLQSQGGINHSQQLIKGEFVAGSITDAHNPLNKPKQEVSDTVNNKQIETGPESWEVKISYVAWAQKLVHHSNNRSHGSDLNVIDYKPPRKKLVRDNSHYP